MQSIGDGAFNNCYKLTDLNVPTSVTQIGTNAFGYVRNIIYNGSASEDCYMDLCYWGARCKNGYFHDSVYYADATMHSLMSVHPLAKNITIHNTTQSVANFAFYHCDVQSITYPSSVTSLGDQLYDGSTELRHIYCESTTPPSMSSWYDPLEFNYDSVTVHVPCGSLLNYTGSWHCFSHFIEAEAEYTIGVSSNNVYAGTATILLSPSCSSNEVVIIAQPNDGFFFSMWNDSVTSNPRYLVLENDLNLVAIFTSTPPAPDTVHVHDTTYVPVHDTTVVSIHDTTYVNVHDTTYITLTDTVTNTIYDTITNTVFDTVTNTIYDTTVVYSTDTLWLHDTVFVHDTIYIYDTVYVGVDDVETISAKIYTSRQQIVVEGASGNTVWLYDINGRMLATKQDEYSPLHFDVPASGAYLVKIGKHPARKVVVIR